MTLRSQILADVSTVFLNQEDFAESVTRYPGGQSPSASVVAIWEPEDYFTNTGPAVDHSIGQKIPRRGRLFVSASQTATQSDTWEIAGELWQTEKLGTAADGLRIVYLRRDDLIRREQAGGLR